jgi:hypothetical protein
MCVIKFKKLCALIKVTVFFGIDYQVNILTFIYDNIFV